MALTCCVACGRGKYHECSAPTHASAAAALGLAMHRTLPPVRLTGCASLTMQDDPLVLVLLALLLRWLQDGKAVHAHVWPSDWG
eukprot:90793-Chlamydomonas_euryale.AAC.1